jgi:hypothetical protein
MTTAEIRTQAAAGARINVLVQCPACQAVLFQSQRLRPSGLDVVSGEWTYAIQAGVLTCVPCGQTVTLAPSHCTVWS